MRRTRIFSYKNRIALSFSVVIIFTIFISGLIYLNMTKDILKKHSYENMQAIVKSVSSQIDTVVRQMDYLAMAILGDRKTLDLLMKIESESRNDLFTQNLSDLNFQNHIDNLFFSLNTPLYIAQRATVFSSTYNYCFSSGISRFSNNASRRNISSIPWEEAVLQANGSRVMIPPHNSDWVPGSENEQVFSLARSIRTSYGQRLGCIEIQQSYSALDKILQTSIKNQILLVTDQSGNVIYPVDFSDASAVQRYVSAASNNHGEFPFAIGSDHYLYSTGVAGYPNWRVTVLYSYRELENSLNNVRSMMLFTGIILLAVMLYSIFFVSRWLSRPINHMIEQIQLVDTENLSLSLSVKPGHHELEQLNELFQEMFSKLRQNVNAILLSQEAEMKAFLLALQSQVDPHFLYNTITTIGILAEENGNKRIEQICTELVMMLRYIGSFKDATVTLADEILHTKRYLSLIKIRYEDDLQYSLEIDGDPESVKCPKLLIQPLVENSLKHGLQNVPTPWIISIKVNVEVNGSWRVCVSDNGSGFTPQTMRELTRSLQSSDFDKLKDATWRDKHLLENGIGILNTHFRLCVFYKDAAQISIQNGTKGGAIVTITCDSPFMKVERPKER